MHHLEEILGRSRKLTGSALECATRFEGIDAQYHVPIDYIRRFKSEAAGCSFLLSCDSIVKLGRLAHLPAQ